MKKAILGSVVMVVMSAGVYAFTPAGNTEANLCNDKGCCEDATDCCAGDMDCCAVCCSVK